MHSSQVDGVPGLDENSACDHEIASSAWDRQHPRRDLPFEAMAVEECGWEPCSMRALSGALIAPRVGVPDLKGVVAIAEIGGLENIRAAVQVEPRERVERVDVRCDTDVVRGVGELALVSDVVQRCAGGTRRSAYERIVRPRRVLAQSRASDQGRPPDVGRTRQRTQVAHRVALGSIDRRQIGRTQLRSTL